jgi:hypothetical protein
MYGTHIIEKAFSKPILDKEFSTKDRINQIYGNTNDFSSRTDYYPMQNTIRFRRAGELINKIELVNILNEPVNLSLFKKFTFNLGEYIFDYDVDVFEHDKNMYNIKDC